MEEQSDLPLMPSAALSVQHSHCHSLDRLARPSDTPHGRSNGRDHTSEMLADHKGAATCNGESFLDLDLEPPTGRARSTCGRRLAGIHLVPPRDRCMPPLLAYGGPMMALTDVGCASQPPCEGARYVVHIVNVHPLAVRLSQEAEHVRPPAVSGQISRPWDHVKVNVAEALRLRELHDVRLLAASHGMQCSRQAHLPVAQPGGLRIGQVSDAEHVTARNEYEPAWQPGAYGMRHAPVLISCNPLARWQLVKPGGALTGKATSLDCHCGSRARTVRFCHPGRSLRRAGFGAERRGLMPAQRASGEKPGQE
ncbi:hypothetical protein GA0074692_5095 [Micromonospora pallida]|uniref:Uncharacterized protein n=1 Tax=Micromonospora pallida TaxID=145854 RepID=A0A1C6TA41_9ACTN|nr:hypothetical protein GA0074692_5095 [Micromonospora pallida]